jgi:ABC-type nitrate/sulfonate/bicarbonate transport system permease component
VARVRRVSTTHDGTGGYAGYLLWEHLYMTLRRVFVGVGSGVLLGQVMGSVGWVRSVLEPWLTFLRALPPLALAALPPAAVATTAAVVAAPVGLTEAARAVGATRAQVIRDVVVPSALPETFTGIRLAVGMAYSSVVAAELFNGIPGIGGLVACQTFPSGDLMVKNNKWLEGRCPTTTSSGPSSTPAPTSTPRSSPRNSTSARWGRAPSHGLSALLNIP